MKNSSIKTQKYICIDFNWRKSFAKQANWERNISQTSHKCQQYSDKNPVWLGDDNMGNLCVEHALIYVSLLFTNDSNNKYAISKHLVG